jgi:hypothetical protein
VKYLLLFILLFNCSKDPVSFDPRVTISKEIIKFFYEENKQQPVME